MNKYFFIFILFNLFSSDVFCQNIFQRRIGNDFLIREVNDIKYSSNNLTILATIGGCFNADWYPRCSHTSLLVIDSTDQIVHVKAYKTYDTSIYLKNFIITGTNKYVLVGGYFTDVTEYGSNIAILDSQLNFVEGKAFRYSGINSFSKIKFNRADKSYYVIGSIDSVFAAHRTQANTICKFDSSFNPIWSKTFSSQFGSIVEDFEISNNNLFLTGEVFDSIIPPFEGFIAKMDTAGVIVWQKKYSGGGNIQILNLRFQGLEMLINGYMKDTVNNKHYTFLSKVDTSGNVIWLKEYDFNGINREVLTVVSDGYLLSNVYPNGGYAAATLIKTDLNGDVRWSYFYPNAERLIDIVPANNNQIYGLGEIRLSTPHWNSKNNIFLLKGDSMGITGCFEQSINVPTLNSTLFIDTVNFSVQDYLPVVTPFTISQVPLTLYTYHYCNGFINTEDIHENNLSIYPNPSTGKVLVDDSIVGITVFNSYGEQIEIEKEKYDNNSVLFDFDFFPSGVYFFRFHYPIPVVKKILILK